MNDGCKPVAGAGAAKGTDALARKPNYRFDRMEKDRAKAAKKADRLKAKQEKSAKGRQSGGSEELGPRPEPAEDKS